MTKNQRTDTRFKLNCVRLALMAGLCTISLGTIAKLSVSQTLKGETGQLDTTAQTFDQNFDYPEQVNLPSWQFKTSEKAIVEGKPAGQQYTLQKNDLTANITAFHQPYSDGNISRLLVAYTEAKPATVYIHPLEHRDTGHFGAFVFENQAYISACLNPNGLSTVTEQQFVSNQYRHNLNLLGWLAGQKDLTDSSCLWTLVSAPIAPDSTPEETTQIFQQLETAWVEWYQWWQVNENP